MKQVDNLVLISGVTWTRNAESIKRNDVSVVRKNILFVFVRRKSFDRSPGFFYPSCAPLSLFYLVALLVRTMFTFFTIHHEKFFFLCPFNLDDFIGSFAGTVDIFDKLPTKRSWKQNSTLSENAPLFYNDQVLGFGWTVLQSLLLYKT